MKTFLLILMWAAIGIAGFLLFVILLDCISVLFVNPKREYDKESGYFRFLLNLSTALAMIILRVRIHVTGLENVPEDGRFLLVSNHRSKFDPIVTWRVLRKKQLAFVSKKENFSIPVFGRMIRKCCFMSIDRENPRNAMVTVNNAAELIKKDGNSVAIYPEGTRNRASELLPFHNCIFKVAKIPEVPIVVMTVRNTENIQHNFPFAHSDVYLDFIETIPTDFVRENNTAVLGERVRKDMDKKLREYAHEEEKNDEQICYTA